MAIRPTAKIKVDEKIFAKIISLYPSMRGVVVGDEIYLDFIFGQGGEEWRGVWRGETLFPTFSMDAELTEFLRAEYPEAFI